MGLNVVVGITVMAKSSKGVMDAESGDITATQAEAGCITAAVAAVAAAAVIVEGGCITDVALAQGLDGAS